MSSEIVRSMAGTETVEPLEAGSPGTVEPVETVEPLELALEAGTIEPVETVEPLDLSLEAGTVETEDPLEVAWPGVSLECPVAVVLVLLVALM